MPSYLEAPVNMGIVYHPYFDSDIHFSLSCGNSTWYICREEWHKDKKKLSTNDGVKHSYYFAFSLSNMKASAKTKLKDPGEKEYHKVYRAITEKKITKKEVIFNLAKFIRKIERKLKIKKYTKIYTTQKEHMVLIKPTGFWSKYPHRHNLFTILLRCGCYYRDKLDFDEVLYANDYARDTMFAVDRFLKGYTMLDDDFEDAYTGWVDYFEEVLMRDASDNLRKAG